ERWTFRRFKGRAMVGLCVLGLLLAGCQQRTPDSSATPRDAVSNTPAAGQAAPVNAHRGETAAEMIQIPAGRFIMGDKNEVDAAPHEVAVSAFSMDKNLVTQEHYQKLMGANPSRWKGDKNPVEQVRWSDAVRFCNKRSELEELQACYDLQTWTCNFEANG